MDQWGVWPASPTPLTRFIGLAPLRRKQARPTHRTPPLRSAKAHGSWKSGVASLNQIFGQGHIGRGWTTLHPLLSHHSNTHTPACPLPIHKVCLGPRECIPLQETDTTPKASLLQVYQMLEAGRGGCLGFWLVTVYVRQCR